MQQFLDPPENSRIIIAVDEREDRFFDETFQALGASVERRMLSVGDFLCSSRLAVERKTRSDFEQSVIDGRLFSQLPNLVSNYERVVIVVEGLSDEERLSRESLLGAYATILADFGASLIFTRDKNGTAELVFHLAKHEQVAKKQPMRIYAKKRTFTPSQTARSIVESLPMVGPKLAKALLNHFGSVEALAHATE
ncbi:MAG: ERCC4 domain-containing protein, partial [Candidatus Micrarchaeota archaeon]